jgi:hypothetical protein
MKGINKPFRRNNPVFHFKDGSATGTVKVEQPKLPSGFQIPLQIGKFSGIPPTQMKLEFSPEQRARFEKALRIRN